VVPPAVIFMNLSTYPQIERAAYVKTILAVVDNHPEIKNGKDFIEHLSGLGLETNKIKEVILDLLNRRVCELTEDRKFIRRLKLETLQNNENTLSSPVDLNSLNKIVKPYRKSEKSYVNW
jgi:hypothetical protein